MHMVEGMGRERKRDKIVREGARKNLGLDCTGSYKELRFHPTGDGVLLKNFRLEK